MIVSWSVTNQFQSNPLAVHIHTQHLDPDMLVNRDNLIRVWNETVGQLRKMDQTILFDTYVDKCAKVGDIAYDTGEFHTFAQVVDGAYILVELENLYRTSRCLLYTSDAADE